MLVNEAAFRENGGTYHLLEDLVYDSERFNATIVVPAGFISDLASVPDIIPPVLVNDSGKITYAAIVHDFLYATEGAANVKLTKAQADRIFLDIMLERGMKKWRAYIAYLGVRLNLYRAYLWDK